MGAVIDFRHTSFELSASGIGKYIFEFMILATDKRIINGLGVYRFGLRIGRVKSDALPTLQAPGISASPFDPDPEI